MSYLPIALPSRSKLLCIIHVVRTGRNTSWIWLIIFVPYVGGVACLLVEVLPTLGRGGRRTIASTRDIVQRTFNPTAHLKALVLYEKLASGMHARDADLALARARCLYRLGRHPDGTRLLDELEAAGHDFRTIPEALVRLKLLEGAGSDGVAVAAAWARFERKFQSIEFAWHHADFLVRTGRKAEALAVIDRVEEAKRQLDAMGQPFDRAWMRRVLRLRATIGE
jgi:hypothetical protein